MTWAKRGDLDRAPAVIRFYRGLAEEQKIPLAPVSEVFDRINRTHPEIDLYAPDGGHASAAGDYLVAAVFARLLTGKNDLSALSDRTYDRTDTAAPPDADGLNAVLPPETAKAIREAVASVR